MPKVDLVYGVPEILAESASLNDLLEAITDMDEWQERHAQILDHIYRQRLVRVLRSAAPAEEVRSLLHHLDLVTHPARITRLKSLDMDYGARWLGYMALLETRLAALESEAPDKLMGRAHVQRILELVTTGQATTQSQLKAHLNLKPANLTRILNLMETNELIEREPVGREKRLKPGSLSLRFVATERRQVSGEPRGMQYLRSEQAA